MNFDWRTRLILGIVVGTALIAGPLAVAFGRSGRQARLLGKNYSLLSKKEIVDRVADDFVNPKTVLVTSGERKWEIELVGWARISPEKTASNMLFRRLKSGLWKYYMDYQKNRDFELVWQIDNGEFDKRIAKIAEEIDKPYVPSELVLDKKVILKPGEIGLRLEREKIKEILVEQWQKYDFSSTALPVEEIGRIEWDEEVVAAATEIANKLVGKKMVMTLPDDKIEITDKELVSWVGVGEDCQKANIEEYVTSLSGQIVREPQDAVFSFENEKVMEFLPSKPGYRLDDAQLSQKICQTLIQLAESEEKMLGLEPNLAWQEPKIETGEVNDLGIRELIGRGESSFSHSSAIRNLNVEQGARAVNRILVAPGEEFSFVKSLGKVTIDAGFKMAYVIRQGKTVLDVGGGICQVSTTLFRAMLDAGLDISERKNHAYRVSYYEEDSKPGFDATVYIPSPDLRFVNDTGHYVLIQSHYDGIKKKLVYEIYGTWDGREVEIANYRQWGYAPPPPDVWIDDPTLPAGKIIKEETRVPGLKTAFDWIVKKDGQILREKTFSSNFVPWAAVYRRGTGN